MVNIITKINGESVTLADNGDGTYSINLGTRSARLFVRKELQQINEEITIKLAEKDSLIASINRLVSSKEASVAAKNILNTDINTLRTNKDELTAWLRGQGDPIT